MKKYFLILIIALTVFSCVKPVEYYNSKNAPTNWYTVIHEGHKYICVTNSITNPNSNICVFHDLNCDCLKKDSTKYATK